jgi:hypothetical protein
VKLEEALSQIEGRQLDAALGHWNLDRHAWPIGEIDRRRMLREALTSKQIMEKRLAQLPSRLRDLLVYVVRTGLWADPFDLRGFDQNEIPVDDFELLPVGTALAERAFFVPKRIRGKSNRGTSFCIPEELGHLLEDVFNKSKGPVDASLNLQSHIRFLDRGELLHRLSELGLDDYQELDHGELRTRLCVRASIDSRVARIKNDELRTLFDNFTEHGGILDPGTLRRLGIDVEAAELQEWGRDLEQNLLGSFESSELANHGLACREGWLVIFGEVSAVLMGMGEVDQDEASADLQRGGDSIADLRTVAAEIGRSPFRIKKSGEYYKAGVKRMAKDSLSPGKRLLGEEEDLLWFLSYFKYREFTAVGLDSCLKMTPPWRDMLSQSAADQATDLFKFGMKSRNWGMSPIHHKGLREGLIEFLKVAGVGVWCDAATLVQRSRNRYFKSAVRPEQSVVYQERHKNAPFPTLASPELMHRELQRWIVEGLTRVGAIELARRGREKRPWAIRLTPLGGALLGLEVAADAPNNGIALIVNPDHEIIAFPENSTPDLVHELGRFAKRVKADFALHYHLSSESVQEAAASGMTADEILHVLEEHTRHGIPENVAFSIRDWCDKLVHVTSRRLWVLEANSAGEMDRIAGLAEIKPMIVGRLNDTMVEVNEDPKESGLVNLLRDRGIYFG